MPQYRDEITRRQRYENLVQELTLERSNVEGEWRDVGDWLCPHRLRFSASERNKGTRPTTTKNVIDSTARFSARTLSAGMHAGLTSPARPWLKLTTPDPTLAEFGPVKNWLHVVTSRMLTIFATTNLYQVLPLVYLDMGVFGTAAMAALWDEKDIFRCYSYPLGSFAMGQDARGLISSFTRTYQRSVRQVVEDFGVSADGRTIDWSNISTLVKDLWDKGNYQQAVEITWLVKPNEEEDRKKFLSKYLPWTSCYWETGGGEPRAGEKKFLRESGFKTFPIMGPRWEVTGDDTYGTDAPGRLALGDVRQLQIMQRRKAQLLSKAVDPPLRGPAELRSQKTSLLPGKITYVNVREGMQGLAPIHEVRLEGFQHLTQDMGDVQYRIQRAFYEDLFLMMARSDDRLGADRPTATEVLERKEEKLLVLGPVVEGTNDELLDPIIDRTFSLMLDADQIPEPPEELLNVQLKVEYISMLSQAQKLVGVVGQDRFLQSSMGMAEVWPNVRHKVNVFQALDNYGEMLGVDPRILIATEDAEAAAQAEAQAAQDQAESEQAVNVAKAAQLASNAPIGGNTALAALTQGAQQAGA